MGDELKLLIEVAKRVKPTPEHREGMSRCLLKFSKRSLRIEIYAASAI